MALLVEDQAEAQSKDLEVLDTDHVVEVVLVVTKRQAAYHKHITLHLVEQGVTILLLLGIMVQVDLVQGVEHRLLLP